MADILLPSYVQFVLRNLETIVAEKTLLRSQQQEELQKLCDSLKVTLLALEYSQENHLVTEHLKKWLRRLRNVVYDVDDLSDEMAVEAAMRRKKNQGDLHRKVFSAFSYLIPPKLFAFSRKVNVLRSRLDELVRHARVFNSVASVNFTRESRETSSFYFSNEIVGRGEEIEQLVNLIRGPIAEAEELSYVAIVGLGGIGKSALAKLIFHDSRIKNNFDIMLWVDVSEIGNMKSILKQLIASATEEGLRLAGVEEMTKRLREVLGGRKYFLVLDDCWSTKEIRALRGVIDCGNRGSTVLVTSRFEDLALSLGSTHVHRLSPLSEESSFRIFTNLAFSSIGKQTQPILEVMAKEIVKQCRGIPLFLILLGGMLRGKTDVREWKQVLCTLEQVDLAAEGIGRVFQSVYNLLPSYLKLPFCSLPLKNHYGASADEVVCIWMALGFLHSDEHAQHPEYIGKKYLSELAKLCLLQDVQYAAGGVVSEFRMHDLVYDLAMSKAGDQLALRNRETYEETEARWIILDVDDLRGINFHGFLLITGKARAFMLCTQEETPIELLNTIVSQCKFLRVLGLGGCDIEILPDSIGRLKYLRYLDVGRNPRLKRIPDSICDLLLLQTLFLHGCEQLEEVPASIGRLEALRYLTLTTQQESLPDGIGDLRSLRTMGLDHCPRLAHLPCSIKNLKNLQTLGLVDCEELDLMDDSSADGLSGLDGIETLLLVGLPKFVGLALLGIGAASLKQLHIQNCPYLTETTWIKQFTILQSLKIEDCPALLAVGDPSAHHGNLEELLIRFCESLTNITWINQFVSLCSLVIEDCPDLSVTGDDIREIVTMQQLEMRRCPLLTDVAWIDRFVLLRSLILEDCPNLAAIGEGISKITNMQMLEIKECPKLMESCSSPSGKDWHHIQHIPKILLEE